MPDISDNQLAEKFELVGSNQLRLRSGYTFYSDVLSGLTDAFQFPINGGGVTIATGLQRGELWIPWACTITKWTLLGDVSGSIVVDIWKDTYANHPPTVADTITASAKPTITTATKAQSSTLTGWTTSLPAESILRFNVDSVTTIAYCTVVLSVTRS